MQLGSKALHKSKNGTRGFLPIQVTLPLFDAMVAMRIIMNAEPLGLQINRGSGLITCGCPLTSLISSGLNRLVLCEHEHKRKWQIEMLDCLKWSWSEDWTSHHDDPHRLRQHTDAPGQSSQRTTANLVLCFIVAFSCTFFVDKRIMQGKNLIG